MSQSPSPFPQYPYPGGPLGGRPRDPRATARRASLLMWVLGAGCVLFGICGAALLMPLMEWMVNNSPPQQAEQLREQLRHAEAQSRQAGMSLSTNMMITGLVIIAIGGTLGVLAFFVRGGSRVATIISAVVTGLVLGLVLLQVLAVAVIGGAQGVMAACMMLVPGGLLALLLFWLIQTAKHAPQGLPYPHQGGQPYAGGQPSQQATWPPPGSPPFQPPGFGGGMGAAPPPPGMYQPPSPPPGQPPVQFGYATRPLTQQASAPQPPAPQVEQQPAQGQPKQDPPSGGGAS